MTRLSNSNINPLFYTGRGAVKGFYSPSPSVSCLHFLYWFGSTARCYWLIQNFIDNYIQPILHSMGLVTTRPNDWNHCAGSLLNTWHLYLMPLSSWIPSGTLGKLVWKKWRKKFCSLHVCVCTYQPDCLVATWKSTHATKLRINCQKNGQTNILHQWIDFSGRTMLIYNVRHRGEQEWRPQTKLKISQNWWRFIFLLQKKIIYKYALWLISMFVPVS